MRVVIKTIISMYVILCSTLCPQTMHPAFAMHACSLIYMVGRYSCLAAYLLFTTIFRLD